MAENITVTEWHEDNYSINEETRQNKKASTEDSAEADVIEKTNQRQKSNDSKEKDGQTMINHQTNIIQNGDHNVNVTNNGTMNLKL